MKVYEAPQEPKIEDITENSVSVFLAGGISKCPDWQAEVIDELRGFRLDDLLLFNPRRSDFDINDKDASRKQIEWEFNHLNNIDIFSMYFAKSDSVQPICMYELGRNIERMIHRFPFDWKDRIIINIEDGYSRTEDVIIQTGLATDGLVHPHLHATPDSHATDIFETYCKVRWKR